MWSPLQQLFKIDAREVEFSRRGFAGASQEVQCRLENVGRVFLQGYHTALQHRDQNVLTALLNQIELEHRGFAFEGAGMAILFRDQLSFRRDGLRRFLDGGGKRHIFMLHVGAGWACARLPWLRCRVETVINNFHPVLRCLVIDGYGFHEGYFHWKKVTGSQDRPHGFFVPSLSEDLRHVFFQGLGRSLWFIHGADVRRISAAIESFHPDYYSDAWSGAGLACAYAGGLCGDSIAQLRREAGAHSTAVAQGAAFAAKARQLAGNPAKHTEVACDVLCGMSTEHAAVLCDETFHKIDVQQSCPYQHWRKLLQEALLSSSHNFKRGRSHESSISLAAAQPY